MAILTASSPALFAEATFCNTMYLAYIVLLLYFINAGRTLLGTKAKVLLANVYLAPFIYSFDFGCKLFNHLKPCAATRGDESLCP